MKRVFCEDDGLHWKNYCPVHHKVSWWQRLKFWLEAKLEDKEGK